MNSTLNWIKKRYRKTVNSIAFYPAVIALSFLILSYLLISLDYSETGKHIKSQLHWLRLKDASTARSIISSIVAGIISLTVFSFSNVMIILNQTASQMSNRILDKLIGNRFQQVVLGIYIGTIVFALFLLSVIRDIDSGIYVPAISTYILITLTVFDIFLFIYFIHFITQSVKYEVIIERIGNETLTAMKKTCREAAENETGKSDEAIPVTAASAGIYESFDPKSLLSVCREHDCTIRMNKVPGTFVLDNNIVLFTSKALPGNVIKQVREALEINNSESIENNFLYGFRQLTEVAMRALSPGINDPGTAIQSLRELSKLLEYRITHSPATSWQDEEGMVRISSRQPTFDDIFRQYILPIWDYGKGDRMVLQYLQQMLAHILAQKVAPSAKALLVKTEKAIAGK